MKDDLKHIAFIMVVMTVWAIWFIVMGAALFAVIDMIDPS